MITADTQLLALYFSMHDCPPCQVATPILAELYNETNSEAKKMEIVFFSGDKTQELFDKYYAEQPWLAVPRAADIIKTVAMKF